MAALLSLGRDGRWRRFLSSLVNAVPGSWVLDAASGTALVAMEVAARENVRVAALDRSAPMLWRGIANVRGNGLGDRIAPVLGRAERLPFPDETFDAVTFTYLMRYVDDPEACVAELARVLRPGGVMAGLEFHVPRGVWHGAWWLHTRLVLPAVCLAVSRAWCRTGRFLGPSISAFWGRYPLAEQVRWWHAAGMRRVRTRTMSLGGGVVTWGTKGRG